MFDPNNLHHAYIIEGDKEAVLKKIKSFLEKELKFVLQGNPDFYLLETDKFGIDEGRELKERQQQKAFGRDSDKRGGTRKIFVVAANSFTREAQNSLLKIFEEPTAGTHFFVVVPSAERLLPTLRSRASILQFKNDSSPSSTIYRTRWGDASEFLKAKPTKRLEIVKGMLEQLKNEEVTKSDFLSFLNEIEKIKNVGVSANTTFSEREDLERFLKMRNYLQDQSSSAKLILEYLALTLS